MAITKLWTVEALDQLPDDGFRYVLVRGVLYRMPPPMARHGRIVSTIGRYLGNFVEEYGFGVIYDQSGFILERSPDTLLSPDLAFVQRNRVPEDENAYPMLAPDLVIEVVSPSQTGPTIEEKTSLYLVAGVRLVWTIDPSRRTVRIHRAVGSDLLLSEEDMIDGEDVLPGFRLPIARFFA